MTKSFSGSSVMNSLTYQGVVTGTAASVGLGMKPPQYLKSGDVVELGIEGPGDSRQRVVNFFRALFKDGVNRSCASTLTSISDVIRPIVTL